MRQVVLDTETTGLNPKEGHRIIEIACVEMVNRRLTGRHYQQYINPQRDIDYGAEKVHGISLASLADKPLFADVVDEFIAFIDGAELIIHNAPFDVGFLNHEFGLLKRKVGPIHQYCQVLDTLEMARRLHPGQRNSLDALCKRYDIDNSGRDLHGALIDSDLLALTYLAMTSGQESLFAEGEKVEKKSTEAVKIGAGINVAREFKVIRPTESELLAHAARVVAIKEKSTISLWESE